MLASVGRVVAQRLAPRRIAASSSGYIVRVGRLAALQPHGSSALLGAAFTKRTYAAAAPKKTAAGKTATATATKAKAKPRKTAAAAAAPTKKAAPKKKTIKAKTAASKTKKQPVVRRPRKVISPEEKLEKKQAAQKKLWKEKAMLGAEPKVLPYTAWTVYTQESFTGGSEGGGTVGGDSLGNYMTKLSETFKALPSAELQVCNSLTSTRMPYFANQTRATEIGSHRRTEQNPERRSVQGLGHVSHPLGDL